MPRTQAAAFREFRDGLQRVVNCLSPAVLVAHGGEHGRPDRLVLPPQLIVHGVVALRLGVTVWFDIVQTSVRARTWSLQITKYIYEVLEYDEIIMAYHYHPTDTPDISFPHLHVYRSGVVGNRSIGRMHLLTGRISLADFVSLLHREFEVPYLRGDAEEILQEVEWPNL